MSASILKTTRGVKEASRWQRPDSRQDESMLLLLLLLLLETTSQDEGIRFLLCLFRPRHRGLHHGPVVAIKSRTLR